MGLAFLGALGLVLSGCVRKSDPAEATKKFFAQLAAGQSAQAYAEAAFGFHAKQSEPAFVQTAREMGLTEQESLTLETPEVKGAEANVRVEVTLQGGQKHDLVVTLVDESGAWRVHSLRAPFGSRSVNLFSLMGRGASFSDAQSQPIPEDAEIQKLIRQTIAKFDEAVQAKSFAGFYEFVAVSWQKQLTVPQLERAFAPFIANDVKIGGLNDAEMQLDGPPTINTEGILLINGHVNTAPYQVYFHMKFIYEIPRWKLFGLDVNLQR